MGGDVGPGTTSRRIADPTYHDAAAGTAGQIDLDLEDGEDRSDYGLLGDADRSSRRDDILEALNEWDNDFLRDLDRPFSSNLLGGEDSSTLPWRGGRARQLADSPLPRRRYGLLGFDDALDRPEASQVENAQRVPLPPFLFRSLRQWRSNRNALRDGQDGIATDSANYVADIDLDLSYEGLLALSERIGVVRQRGASQAAMAAGLEKFAYRAGIAETEQEEIEVRCGICLEDYAENDECARSKTCGHGLHTVCLETWLAKNETCPICRQKAV